MLSPSQSGLAFGASGPILSNPANRSVVHANIAVINRGTIVDDASAQAVVAALQQQVTNHFAPIWGIDATLSFYGKSQDPPPDLWWLVILDDSDQAGALGYHDLTDQGLPLGKVFAKTDQVYGTQWSVTASHELLEMLGDPYINLAAIKYPGENGTYMSLYAYEVCDPCEADRYSYPIDNVLVSDFVYPTWFEYSFFNSGKRFDYLDKIPQPLELLSGGYIGRYDVQFGAGWVQQAGPDISESSYSSRAQVGSRRERRRMPRDAWQLSRPHLQTGRSSAPIVAPPLPFPAASQQASASDRGSRIRSRTVAAIKQAGEQQSAMRQVIAADRAARYQAFLRQVQNPLESPGVGTRSAAPAVSGKRPLRILAEGDSWFEYPLPPSFGVISELENMLGYSIANMAQAGEEVRQMLGLAVRQEIIARLSDQGNVRYDALLFSGGGDDLVGDALATFLNNQPPAVPPPQMLNSASLGAALSLLEAEYRELIAIRDRYSPGTVIAVNCYDFPPITGIGVCGKGPWLKPSLDYAYGQVGVSNPNPADEFLVVREMLQRFRAMLVEIGNDSTVKDFYVIETQGTLNANSSDWANELHPTQTGFQKIARRFQSALQTIFP